MVNLVVRNGTHLHNTTVARSNSPAALAVASRYTSKKPSVVGGSDRVVPSPIRVPSYQNTRRPLSPLTTSETMYGNAPGMQQNRSQSSETSSRRGTGGRLEPVQSMDSTTDEHGDLVCDYDKNVTPLYELLESSQWDQARLRCRTNPEEVQTWIVRRDANAKIRWKLLPLHAAVIFQAPAQVIEGMLKEYPIAAGKRDDQGMLPLHLAFRHKQEESMLILLLSHFPQAVLVKDRRDRLPVDHGREVMFSSVMLQKYAEAHAKTKSMRGASLNETRVKQEAQLDALKTKYEERIASLARQHEQEIHELNQKAEQDEHVVRAQHEQEIDELRELFSREVVSGQGSHQMQQEIQSLQESLSKSNSEVQFFKDLLHSQKAYHEELQEQVTKVLADQNTLNTFCTQQQQELDQAHKLREQLLRTLVQKDDGNAVRTSREICQLSDNIRLRTEQILSQAKSVRVPLDPKPTTGLQPQNQIDHDVSNYNDHHHRNDTPWRTDEANDHGDDISAITDDHF